MSQLQAGFRRPSWLSLVPPEQAPFAHDTRFDVQSLLEIGSLREDSAREIAQDFLSLIMSARPALSGQGSAAIADVARVAHKLRASCVALHANRAAHLLLVVEQQASSGTAVGRQSLWDVLEELDDLEWLIQTWLDEARR